MGAVRGQGAGARERGGAGVRGVGAGPGVRGALAPRLVRQPPGLLRGTGGGKMAGGAAGGGVPRATPARLGLCGSRWTAGGRGGPLGGVPRSPWGRAWEEAGRDSDGVFGLRDARPGAGFLEVVRLERCRFS